MSFPSVQFAPVSPVNRPVRFGAKPAQDTPLNQLLPAPEKKPQPEQPGFLRRVARTLTLGGLVLSGGVLLLDVGLSFARYQSLGQISDANWDRQEAYWKLSTLSQSDIEDVKQAARDLQKPENPWILDSYAKYMSELSYHIHGKNAEAVRLTEQKMLASPAAKAAATKLANTTLQEHPPLQWGPSAHLRNYETYLETVLPLIGETPEAIGQRKAEARQFFEDVNQNLGKQGTLLALSIAMALAYRKARKQPVKAE